MKRFSPGSSTTGSSAPRHASYHTRLLAALAGSLLLLVMLARLPLHPAEPQVGWHVKSPGERIHLQELAEEEPREANEDASDVEGAPDVDVPPTAHSTRAVAEPMREPASKTPVEPDRTRAPEDDEAEPDIYQLSALGPAAQHPRILGGSGTFFLRINYPEEARRQGIEGRVILDFVVDTEGNTHDIIVRKSLHPLCDSSAVRALRATRFVPGRRAGEPVNVRMRLPVRFRLVNATDPALATDERETSDGS